MNGRLESRKWGFFVFCLFSPCNFSPIFRPVVNSSKGVNEERKLVEVNERFFHDVIECFPQLLLLLLPLQGWLPLLGKGKCSAFYLYTTPPILLPCIDFYSGVGRPAMAVSTTCIFSLLFKDRVRQQVQWRMEEKSPIFARTYNNTNPSTHDCVQRLRSVEAKKTRAVNSLSKHRLSPLVRPLTFWTYMDRQQRLLLSHHGEPISVYRHVGATYNVCSTLP